jgi:hypothetical protein
MSRPVTADHVLFDECIEAFRRPDVAQVPLIKGKSNSYILTSFELPEPWQLPHFTIFPSARVQLPGAMAAFICRVENPDWVGRRNSHLPGIALASIASFATGRVWRSPRDGYLGNRATLDNDQLFQLALQHPVLVAGPGYIHPTLSSAGRERYKTTLSSLVTKLHSVPYKTYVILMQAMRLVHLSLLNKRDDFGLAYLLLVSAIESVAQHAVKRNFVRKTHPSESAWSLKAGEDSAFAELLAAYRDLRGQNQYLQERYIEFIYRFAPTKCWEEIVRHPNQDMVDHIEEVSPSHNLAYVVQKRWFEKYPTDLDAEQVREILADSYTHRSCFIHRGEQPPHREPTSFNRFFQEIREFDGGNVIERLLPNYDLLLGIAQRSIYVWADSK